MKAIYETNPTKVRELVIDMIRKSGDFDKTIKEVCTPNLSIHDTMQLYSDVILAAKGTVVLETIVPGAGMEELNEAQDTEETLGAVAHDRIGRLFSKIVEKCTAGMGADQDDDEDDEEMDDLLEGFSSEDIDKLFAKAVEQSEDCSKNIADALSAGCNLEEAYAKSFETLEKNFYKEYENIRNKQVEKKGKEYAGYIDKALNDPSIIWVDLEELGPTDVEEFLQHSVKEYPQVKQRYLFVFKGAKEYAEAYSEIVEKVSNMKDASFKDVLEETKGRFADKSCLAIIIANDAYIYDSVSANCYNIYYQFKNKLPKTIRLGSAHDINQIVLCAKKTKTEQEDVQKNEEKTEKVEDSKEADFEPTSEPTPKDWIPKKEEDYFMASYWYDVVGLQYNKDFDEKILKYNRIFKSKEECQLYCDINKELRDASREFVPNKNNYFLWYNYRNDGIEINNGLYFQYQTLYFDSVETIKTIIEKYGEENILKYYFGVYK